MEVETRQAALCLIQHGNAFLVAEIQDPETKLVLHRPPGGGIEEGETPEQALRRTNAKFRNRWSHIEARLHEQGKTPEQATIQEMEALWQEAKRE